MNFGLRFFFAQRGVSELPFSRLSNCRSPVQAYNARGQEGTSSHTAQGLKGGPGRTLRACGCCGSWVSFPFALEETVLNSRTANHCSHRAAHLVLFVLA